MTIVEPINPHHRAESDTTSFGSFHVTDQTKGAFEVTTVENDARVDLGSLFILAVLCGCIVATILGMAVANENDGHLELAWTKPVSRTLYLLQTAAIGVLGIVLAEVMTVLAIATIMAMYGLAYLIHVSNLTLRDIAFSLLVALAFYAIVQAMTASTRRTGWAIVSIFWVVSLILPVFHHTEWLNVGSIVRIVNVVNPNAYFYSFTALPANPGFMALPGSATAYFTGLLVLVVAGIGLAIAQWQRVEA
ncbi:MAG: hypothetical protein JOZ38_05650 [Candidatus Eremiobacteraeota bacterium]|nr:hypothetical protein [Candidatus Eremiobacteraeota bacterium]